jgi:long-chain acyl-CoA synthetase
MTAEGSWTFSQVAESTTALARALASLGLRKGERLAALLPNGFPYFLLYFAVPSAGGVCVPINTFLAAPEVATVIEDSGATLLVITRKRLAALGAHLERLPRLRTVIVAPGEGTGRVNLPSSVRMVEWDALGEMGASQALPPPPDPDEPAVLTYTSGTTGRMKGVILSHTNLISNARACLEAVKLRSRDRLLLFLPMFHSLTQMVCLVTPRLAGLPVVLLPGLDRAAILDALKRFRPTIFVAVPAIYATMSERSPNLLTRWLNPVRVYISGGSPLPAEVLERFERSWRRPLCEGYGLSEAAPVVSLNPVDGIRKAGSVGPGLPGVSLKILAEDGGEAAEGEVGEIMVKGPNVMLGYHLQPEETAAVLRDGWLHTGDLGRIDSDGYLFIVGRKKEMLIFRGMNIYPREVEEVLVHHPAVAEAAVVGLDETDKGKGEVPHAAVALRPGATVESSELKRFCQKRLARYKVPRSVLVLPALPKGATGKILKDQVRETILAARPGSTSPRGRTTPPDA